MKIILAILVGGFIGIIVAVAILLLINAIFFGGKK